jgi:hypothetical protein
VPFRAGALTERVSPLAKFAQFAVYKKPISPLAKFAEFAVYKKAD